MATDPKIRYDIQATATGGPEVDRLATELEKLDASIDPGLAARARALAAEVRQLGEQQAAIETFVELKGRTQEARAALDEAQRAARQMGAELAVLDTPTKAQAGAMQKLRDAVRDAKAELIAQTQRLDASRAELAEAGIATEGLASRQVALRTALRASGEEAAALKTQLSERLAAARTQADEEVRLNQRIEASMRELTAAAQQELQAERLAAEEAVALTRRVQAAEAEAAAATAARGRARTADLDSYRAAQTASIAKEREQSAAIGEGSAKASVFREVMTGLGPIIAAVFGAEQVMAFAGHLAEASAQVTNLKARLGLVTAEGQDQAKVFQQVFDIAQATGAPLAATGTLFTRLAGATKEAKATQAEMLGVTKALTQSLAISGATTAETESATVQFSQAMARGVLNGEDLHSVMESAPRLATAMAAGLGISTGKLREWGEQNRLTSEVVVKALLAQSKTIDDEFGKLPVTIARAGQQLSNAWGVFLEKLDSTYQVSAHVAQGLSFVSEHIDELSRVATASVQGTAGVPKLVQALADLYQKTKEGKQPVDDSAAALAAQAAAAKLAADAAAGLTPEAQKLIAAFEALVQKGEPASKAIEAVQKALDFSTPKGIADAAAALDELRKTGAISAKALHDAWISGLKDINLADFGKQARLMFDSSEQGARRLQAALDAVNSEALARAGTSVLELRTGFSTTFKSAMADTDALVTSIKRIGATGDEVGRVLSQSLDKDLAAAHTEKAVQAVIDKWRELGKQGLVSGEQLTAGLQKAKDKLEELTPGIQGLSEALHSFGLKTKAELQDVADKSAQAWKIVSTSAGVSLQDQVIAFNKYHDDAVAANGGVESSTLAAQRQMLQWKIDASTAADGIVGNLSRAGTSVDGLRSKIDSVTAAYRRLEDQSGRAASSASGSLDARNKADLSTTGRFDALDAPGNGGGGLQALQDKLRAGTLTPDDMATARAVLEAAQFNKDQMEQALKVNAAAFTTNYITATNGAVIAAQTILQKITELAAQAAQASKDIDTPSPSPAPSPAPAPTSAAPVPAPHPALVPTPAPNPLTPYTTAAARTVNIDFSGRRVASINVATQADSDALVTLLRRLESAKGVAA